MNKIKQFVSVFLVIVLIITCFPNNSVYAQTEQTESNIEKNLPIDKSYRIKTTEGVASYNAEAAGFILPNYGSNTSSYVEEIEESVGVLNHFDIDWDAREFIFMAHNSEDADENIISLPKEVDVKKVMKIIPATTDSVLSPGKNYKDYTFEELKQLMVD